MTTRIRFIFRLLRIADCLLYGMAEMSFLFPLYSGKRKLRAIQLWSLRVLASCGTKLQTFDTSPQGGRGQIPINNHISQLDIMAINGTFPDRFVAKDGVARWPVIGYLATQVQAIYVSRNRGIKGNSAKIAGVIGTLKNSDTVTVFPEGTSTEGREILPFKPSFFQTTYDAGIPIIPALCHYPNPDGSSPSPHTAHYGDISPWQSVCMVISQSSSTVELHLLDSTKAREDHYATTLQVYALLGEKQKQLG